MAQGVHLAVAEVAAELSHFLLNEFVQMLDFC